MYAECVTHVLQNCTRGRSLVRPYHLLLLLLIYLFCKQINKKKPGSKNQLSHGQDKVGHT